MRKEKRLPQWLETFRRMHVTCGLSRAEYEGCLSDIARNNQMMLSICSVFCVIVYAVMAIVMRGMQGETKTFGINCVMLVITFGALLYVNLFFDKAPKLLLPVSYTVSAFIMLHGIALATLLHPERSSVSFCAMLALGPALFIDKPYRMSLFSGTMLAIFIALAAKMKPEPFADIANAVIFWLLGCFISTYVNHVRLQSFQLIRLRNQMRPHFIYNCLNAISVLCAVEPERAENAIADFADYLRYSLDADVNQGIVPFKEELKNIRTYLSLEQMRFGDELQVVENLDTLDFDVPSLSIQPIVENAVRHGVRKKDGKGCVTLTTKKEDGKVIITVSDDGPGFKKKPEKGVHVGIQNVRYRLAVLMDGEMEITSRPGGGTTVAIRLPSRQ